MDKKIGILALTKELEKDNYRFVWRRCKRRKPYHWSSRT